MGKVMGMGTIEWMGTIEFWAGENETSKDVDTFLSISCHPRTIDIFGYHG